jgi:Pectate lyase superfamily protein
MSLTKVTYSMISGSALNVLDFGADPTGVADSRTAIQAAFDAVAEGQGIDFGNGNTYLLSGTVTLDSKINVSLFGSSTLQMTSNWIVSGQPTQNPMPPNNRIIEIQSCNGVVVNGLTLDGNMTNTPTHVYNGYGIDAASSFDVHYQNLIVKNLGGEALMGEGTDGLWIENCKTINVNHGVNIFGSCTQVYILNNYIEHNSFAIFGEGVVGCVVDGNICIQTAVYNTEPLGGIVFKNTAGLGSVDEIVIANNFVITNNLDNSHNIWLNAGSGGSTYFGNVLITNNELHSAYLWGVYAEGTTGLITVTGNQILDSGRANAYQGSGGIANVITATGNYISALSGSNNAIGLYNVGVASNNFLVNFNNEKYVNDRTVQNVAQLTGNYPWNTSVCFNTYSQNNPNVTGKSTVVTRNDDAGEIDGFANGVDGQIVTLIPTKTYTVKNNSSSATQKIYNLSGSDLTLTAWTSAQFYFNGTDWRQIS